MRELPVATEMAGVDVHLKPGAIRNFTGTSRPSGRSYSPEAPRLTAVDQEGAQLHRRRGSRRPVVFPSGIPHSIQGLADGCESLCLRRGELQREQHLPAYGLDRPHAARGARHPGGGRDRGSRAQRHPRASPAPERRRVAVLGRGTQAHDGVRIQRQRTTGTTPVRFLEMFRSDRFPPGCPRRSPSSTRPATRRPAATAGPGARSRRRTPRAGHDRAPAA